VKRLLIAVAAIALGAGFASAGHDSGGGAAAPPPLRVPMAERARSVPSALEAIARCESRSDPTAVSDDGVYRGKYQFDLPTWRSVGGAGDPALASEREQDRRARALAEQRGTAPWPVCGS
jgi:hypothetical protein